MYFHDRITKIRRISKMWDEVFELRNARREVLWDEELSIKAKEAGLQNQIHSLSDELEKDKENYDFERDWIKLEDRVSDLELYRCPLCRLWKRLLALCRW